MEQLSHVSCWHIRGLVGTVSMDEISVSIQLFRYCPSAAESGWDNISCSIPAHATVEDLLIAIQQDVDGSLAFRRGTTGGTPTTGIFVNGRIVLADLARISDVIDSKGTLKIEPAPGLPIIRDLIVAFIVASSATNQD